MAGQRKTDKQRMLHLDGSECLEGTRSVPESYVPCCRMFNAHASCCVYDVRYEYWKEHDQWFIPIAESSGGGGIAISYCPHCGAKLKVLKRKRRARRAAG